MKNAHTDLNIYLKKVANRGTEIRNEVTEVKQSWYKEYNRNIDNLQNKKWHLSTNNRSYIVKIVVLQENLLEMVQI